MEGETISFAGTGTDAEDGTLPDSTLVWTSDQDDSIGTSTSFDRDDLSVNTHVITLTGTDSDGNSGHDHVTITINIDGNDYYPIDVGNVWNYDIANVEVIDEQHTFTDGIGQRVNMTPIPGSDVDVLFLENMINDGVVYLGSYDAIEGFEGDDCDGLFVILKNIMAVGDTWNLEFLAPSSSSGIFTFLGFETVTVPAGSFIDCIKIEVTLNDEEPYTDHLYFAKDVGLVKAERISPPEHTDGWFLLVTSDNRLAELQSATIDGVSYP